MSFALAKRKKESKTKQVARCAPHLAFSNVRPHLRSCRRVNSKHLMVCLFSFVTLLAHLLCQYSPRPGTNAWEHALLRPLPTLLMP